MASLSEPADAGPVICVLGMHRSGTSLITSALNLLGVDLGPAPHRMTPQPDNPRGYFEHRLLTDLSEEILVRFDGAWHTPPSFPNGWESTPALEDLRTRARQVLEEDFGSTPIWGWKDPRTCLTLPFWQQLLPAMRYVVCVRSPLDVARSLEARDGFSTARSVFLWLAYMRGALMHSSGWPRLFVSYDDFIDRCEAEVARMAAFIGGPAPSEESVQRAVASIDAALHHHQTTTADLARDARLSRRVKALYVSFKLLVESQQRGAAGDDELVSRMIMLCDHAMQAQTEEQARLEERIGDLERAAHDAPKPGI